MTKGLFNDKSVTSDWIDGFGVGEAMGRGHVRAAVAKMLRARAMVMEQSIKEKNEADTKGVKLPGVRGYIDVAATMAKIQELHDVALAIENGSWEGPEIEIND